MITAQSGIREQIAPRHSMPRGGISREAITERVQWACQGLRLRRVADLTGCNAETVRRYLLGQGNPPPAFLAALCRGLGLSPSWLLLGEGEPHRNELPREVGFKSDREAVRALVLELSRRVSAL
ncbi:MAG TPA: helix-turn-helix transcriptional regulator [Phycisphaerales bacterium]|nr:helix-turn-helix transcriptional regulator [Phycisphaerales bacterium]